MTPEQELDEILTSHLQDIRAGHDSKLAFKLLAWRDKAVQEARIGQLKEFTEDFYDYKAHTEGFQTGYLFVMECMKDRIKELQQPHKSVGGEE